MPRPLTAGRHQVPRTRSIAARQQLDTEDVFRHGRRSPYILWLTNPILIIGKRSA